MVRKLTLICLLLIASIQAKELHVDTSRVNLVRFISDSPVEDFDGTSDQINGYIVWSGDEPTAESEFYFQVDLNSLDTGIGLRNRHMREKYLETDQYPLATYRGKVTGIDQQSDSTFQASTEGTFSIHGIDKAMNLSGLVTLSDGQYRIESQFDITLTDFDIKVPQLLFLKIDEVVDIRLDFYLKQVNDEN